MANTCQVIQETVRKQLKSSAEKDIWIEGHLLARCLYDSTNGEAHHDCKVLVPSGATLRRSGLEKQRMDDERGRATTGRGRRRGRGTHHLPQCECMSGQAGVHNDGVRTSACQRYNLQFYVPFAVVLKLSWQIWQVTSPLRLCIWLMRKRRPFTMLNG